MVYGLMPAPLEDVAAAVRWIQDRHPGRPYWMTGFSAGGNICALWGTEHLGAAHYEMPYPEALLLDYPLASARSIPAGPVRDYLMQGLFGTGYNNELAAEYDVPAHIHAGYPPVFLVRAEDDGTIPEKDTQRFMAALQKAKIPNHLLQVSSGDHGFGLGSQTPAAGWVDRAIKWVNTVSGDQPLHNFEE